MEVMEVNEQLADTDDVNEIKQIRADNNGKHLWGCHFLVLSII